MEVEPQGQKAVTAGPKVSFDVAKFQDSFDDGQTRHGFKSLKAPLGVRKMPANELHSEHWRLEDSDSRVFEGKKTAMETDNFWVMMPVEGGSVKLVPVSKWYNFTQQMTGPAGQQRSLEQAELQMKKAQANQKHDVESVVKKLNPATEALEGDGDDPATSDLYGIKEAERRRKARIASKARPEGYKAEMDVVDSAGQVRIVFCFFAHFFLERVEFGYAEVAGTKCSVSLDHAATGFRSLP